MSDNQSPLQYKEARDYALIERILRRSRLGIPQIVMLTASALSVALALFHVYVAGFGTPESHSFRSTHLAVMMVLAVMVYPLFRSSVSDGLTGATAGDTNRRRVGFAIDLVLVAMIVMVQSYVLYDVEEFQAREGSLDPSDVWMGTFLVFLVLETTRRAVG